jgi:urea transport system permease protein
VVLVRLRQFWFAALMVVLVPGLLAFVFGWFAFRSRVTGVYLSIITQAMTYALLLAFFRNDMGFGGNNGLTDFKDMLGFPSRRRHPRSRCSPPRAGAGGSAAARRAGIVVGPKPSARCWSPSAMPKAAPASSATGSSIQAVRLHLSAMMAGVAGALYVPQVGIINPANSRRQFHRGRHLGRRRRARHHHRPDYRRGARSIGRRAGSPAPCRNLALRARRRCSWW